MDAILTPEQLANSINEVVGSRLVIQFPKMFASSRNGLSIFILACGSSQRAHDLHAFLKRECAAESTLKVSEVLDLALHGRQRLPCIWFEAIDGQRNGKLHLHVPMAQAENILNAFKTYMEIAAVEPGRPEPPAKPPFTCEKS